MLSHYQLNNNESIENQTTKHHEQETNLLQSQSNQQNLSPKLDDDDHSDKNLTPNQVQSQTYQDFGDSEEMLYDLEQDYEQREKSHLPKPHPMSGLPQPINMNEGKDGQSTVYNHFAPIVKQDINGIDNHLNLLDEEEEVELNHDLKRFEQQNEEDEMNLVISNYHTQNTKQNYSSHQHQFNRKFATNEKYNSSINQTRVVQNPLQIFEDENQNQFAQNNRDKNVLYEIKGSSELYVWGRNQNGQLGIEPSIKSVIKIPHMLKLDFEVRQISCGKSHTALVTSQGSLYTLGSNLKGQLGLGSPTVKYLSSPELVESLSMWTTHKVVCARNSTFALMYAKDSQEKQQYLFSWGSEKDGVLGLGKIEGNQYFPIKVLIDEENEEQIQVLQISAMRSHVGALVKRQGNQDASTNCLYMWGSNKYGQLGVQDFENRNSPTFIDTDYNPIDVACGDSFTIVLSDQNTLYSTGSNLQGQLGQGQSINKQSSFSQIQGLSQFSDKTFIKSLHASDYASFLVSNGDMFIWGPTPIGQFNSPQTLQDLIQNNIPIKNISLGTSFGLIQDENDQSYQLGSLFQENKNTTNFQYLDNMNFLSFQCGHDFVIASAANSGNYTSNVPIQSKSLIRSSTHSALQNHKNILKKRQPSGQSQHLPQILNQSQPHGFNFGQRNQLHSNYSPSPLRISSNNVIDISHQNFNGIVGLNSHQHHNGTQQFDYNRYSNVNQSHFKGIGLPQNMNQTISYQNQQSAQVYNSRRVNDKKHLDSCTPVRRDFTPTNDQIHKNNTGVSRLQQTPSQANTPNNMKLRIQNQSDFQNQNPHKNNQTQQLNHMQSYATDDLLSQTLINTPQHLRRTFAGQPPTSLTHQNHQNLAATPPPFQANYYQPQCNCGLPGCQANQNDLCLSSSYAFNNLNGGMSQSLVFQSMDQNHQQFSQTQNSMYGHNIHNQGYQKNYVDLLIKEKQEIYCQMQVEIQRRLMQEKELQEVYRQLDTLNNQHQANIHELTSMIDISKRDNDILMQQVEEQSQENVELKQIKESQDDQLSTIRQMYEELNEKQQSLQRENEYLKTRVEVAQQFQVLSQQASSQNPNSQTSQQPISIEKLKELEDLLQRKNKDIYELTVQLGSLKEENTQLKKDLGEAEIDFKERLESQQLRAEAQMVVIQEENETLRNNLDEMKVAIDEVEELRQVQNEKDNQINQLQKQIESLREEQETKDDNIKIHKREIQILQSEQDKLMKELKKLQDLHINSQHQRSKQGSISISNNKKALHLSAIVVDESNSDNYQTLNQEVDDILDIEDLRKAANEILNGPCSDNQKQQNIYKTHQSKTGTGDMSINKQQLIHCQNHQHQHIQIMNPIETPLDSQRDSSIYQPIISASVISQQNYSKIGQGQTRQQNMGRQSLTTISNNTNQQIQPPSQMTPKQIMYQQLKQSMGFGKDSRTISNREQGCLQVMNNQRRKSTQANYSNQVKNLRGSKSGTNLKQSKVTQSRIQSNLSNINNSHALNINMNKTDMNIGHGDSKSAMASQRNSIQNNQHNSSAVSRSPINQNKKPQSSQIKLEKQVKKNDIVIEDYQQIHPLDMLCNTLMTDSQHSQAFKSDISPLRSIQNQLQHTQSTSQLHHQGSSSFGKNSMTPLSSMYQKHNLHHGNNGNIQNQRLSAGPINTNSQNNINFRKTQLNGNSDENTTPRHQAKNTVKNTQLNSTAATKQSIQSKSLILQSNAMSSAGPYTQSLTQTPKNMKNIVQVASTRSNNQCQPLTLENSQSKGSLIDMKHKLQDIQHNKQYLEKKIYEYERKLNELKGATSSQQNSGSECDRNIHAQKYNDRKLSQLSAAILEKVILTTKK
eukprot:403351945